MLLGRDSVEVLTAMGCAAMSYIAFESSFLVMVVEAGRARLRIAWESHRCCDVKKIKEVTAATILNATPKKGFRLYSPVAIKANCKVDGCSSRK